MVGLNLLKSVGLVHWILSLTLICNIKQSYNDRAITIIRSNTMNTNYKVYSMTLCWQ